MGCAAGAGFVHTAVGGARPDASSSTRLWGREAGRGFRPHGRGGAGPGAGSSTDQCVRDVPAGDAAHHVGMEDAKDADHPDVSRQVGLALRAHRRELGQSQRAYAAERQISRAQLARMEHDASGVKLGDVADALEGTGYCLAVVPVDAGPTVDWDPTDLEARTRDGRGIPQSPPRDGP